MVWKHVVQTRSRDLKKIKRHFSLLQVAVAENTNTLNDCFFQDSILETGMWGVEGSWFKVLCENLALSVCDVIRRTCVYCSFFLLSFYKWSERRIQFLVRLMKAQKNLTFSNPRRFLQVDMTLFSEDGNDLFDPQGETLSVAGQQHKSKSDYISPLMLQTGQSALCTCSLSSCLLWQRQITHHTSVRHSLRPKITRSMIWCPLTSQCPFTWALPPGSSLIHSKWKAVYQLCFGLVSHWPCVSSVYVGHD